MLNFNVRAGAALILFASLSLASVAVRAEEVPTFELTLENDVFSPGEIKVPAQKAFILKVMNKEKIAIEVEAKDLKIEKVAGAGTEIIARVKPLAPGRYLLVNEYKEETVKTFVVVE